MGIKFLCPNGHKLNVKSFLSGKKAICPKCGARVIVPESDSALDTAGDSSALAQGSWAGTPSGIGGISNGSATSTALAAVAVDVSADPIAEAPEAVWYVRPASGGQFGPASGEIMRAWINEGRVGASSLVWRAGWADWRPAAATFPQLGGLSPPHVAMPAAPVPPSAALPLGHVVESVAVEINPLDSGPLGSTVVPIVAPRKKHRRKNDVSLIASAILVVISIILVIVLILVWRSNQAGTSEDEPQATTMAPKSAPGG